MWLKVGFGCGWESTGYVDWLYANVMDLHFFFFDSVFLVMRDYLR